MCDYSLQNVRSRPAKVAENSLPETSGTYTGLRGQKMSEWRFAFFRGTELAFSSPARSVTDHRFIVGWEVEILGHATAIFRASQ